MLHLLSGKNYWKGYKECLDIARRAIKCWICTCIVAYIGTFREVHYVECDCVCVD